MHTWPFRIVLGYKATLGVFPSISLEILDHLSALVLVCYIPYPTAMAILPKG